MSTRVLHANLHESRGTLPSSERRLDSSLRPPQVLLFVHRNRPGAQEIEAHLQSRELHQSYDPQPFRSFSPGGSNTGCSPSDSPAMARGYLSWLSQSDGLWARGSFELVDQVSVARRNSGSIPIAHSSRSLKYSSHCYSGIPRHESTHSQCQPVQAPTSRPRSLTDRSSLIKPGRAPP